MVIDGDRILFYGGQPPGPMFPVNYRTAYFNGRTLVFTDDKSIATALRHFRVGESEYLLDVSRLSSEELELRLEILDERGMRKQKSP